MSLQLTTQEESLRDCCARVEARCKSAASQLALSVELLSDLSTIEGASELAALRESPALGIPKSGKIIVNDSEFSKLTRDEQDAVLAHEVGHHVNRQSGPAGCLHADAFAAQCGYTDAIVQMREDRWRDGFGNLYAAILTATVSPPEREALVAEFNLRRGLNLPACSLDKLREFAVEKSKLGL